MSVTPPEAVEERSILSSSWLLQKLIICCDKKVTARQEIGCTFFPSLSSADDKLCKEKKRVHQLSEEKAITRPKEKKNGTCDGHE